MDDIEMCKELLQQALREHAQACIDEGAAAAAVFRAMAEDVPRLAEIMAVLVVGPADVAPLEYSDLKMEHERAMRRVAQNHLAVERASTALLDAIIRRAQEKSAPNTGTAGDEHA